MTRRRRLALGIALALLGACRGDEGTISISVVEAPEQNLLAQIARIEATFTATQKTITETRDEDGTLALGLEFVADGSSGDLVLRGYDVEGERIAVGRVGPLPLAAIDAEVRVYMAAPNSIALAPERLGEARSHVAASEASFGALLAGGRTEDGASAEVAVYSTYLHSVQTAAPLPAPRSELTVVPGSTGFFYLLGGYDSDLGPRHESFTFNANVPPSGIYLPIAIREEDARARASAAIVGEEQYVISGDPALLLDGLRSSASPLSGGEGLNGAAATAIATPGIEVLFAGARVVDPITGSAGAAIFTGSEIVHLAAPEELLRTGHRAVTLASGDVLVLGGENAEDEGLTTAVRYSAETGLFEVLAFLETPRIDPAVAVTGRHLLVVGGEDESGQSLDTAELFDAQSLERIATIDLPSPGKNTSAVPIGNGQILIAGGEDSAGVPSDALSLFTPDEP